MAGSGTAAGLTHQRESIVIDPPADSSALVNDGLIRAQQWLRQGNLVEAEARCRQILASQPHHVETLLLLGTLLQQRHHPVQAEQMIRQALRVAPTNAAAQRQLGCVLAAQHRHGEAVAAFQYALRLQPRDAEVRVALGEVLQALGRLPEAVAVWQQAAALWPDDARIHYPLGAALAELGRDAEALVALDLAHRNRPDHDATLITLTTVLHRQGRIEEARNRISTTVFIRGSVARSLALLEHAQALMPDDPVTRHRLAAWFGQETPARAADAYVVDLFDRYADSFDHDLSRLDYQAPELLIGAVAAVLGPPTGTLEVLDAGCGTGLCGPRLRPYARQLIGVDLSPAMIEKARERGSYDALVVAELTAFLGEWPARYDLITLVDTLMYFGDLGPVLTAAAHALRPGGWLAFTVEQAPDEPELTFRLNRSGRYGHTADYVRQTLAATGLLAPCRMTNIILRQEENRPVHGCAVLAQRPDRPGSTA